jgi:uncharacterized membrane protein YphA (DoxX/SURF4 family)
MYLGYSSLVRRAELSKIHLPLIGYPPNWLIWVVGIITTLDGIALFIGYSTQAVAIIGILITLKHIFLSDHWATIRTFERSTYALLCLICLTLIISGAGPLGFDLPL